MAYSADLPDKLQRGQVLTASWLNRLLDAVRARTVSAGPGVRVARSPAGTTVCAVAAPGGQATDADSSLCVIGTIAVQTTLTGPGRVTVEVDGETVMAYLVTSSGYTHLLVGDSVVLHPCQLAIVPGEETAATTEDTAQ